VKSELWNARDCWPLRWNPELAGTTAQVLALHPGGRNAQAERQLLLFAQPQRGLSSAAGWLPVWATGTAQPADAGETPVPLNRLPDGVTPGRLPTRGHPVWEPPGTRSMVLSGIYRGFHLPPPRSGSGIV
jgi:hypothetical protein